MRHKYEQKLAALQVVYNHKLDKLGDEVRREVVLPACRKYNLTFASGMGGYSFYDERARKDGTFYWGDGDDEWTDFVVDRLDAERLGYRDVIEAYDVLDADVDSRGNLGCWVGDVREGDK